MNIIKFLKPILPAVVLASTSMFIISCDSSSDDSTLAPQPVPPVPTDGITGIWTGTLSWETTGQSKNYEVTMLFHTPDGAEEGIAGGTAFGNGPDDIDLPHFLFEGGYQYSADAITSDAEDGVTIKVACEADVWAIGRFGQQGTFVQEFSYITGSAAGPDQRGAGCLYLKDADGDGYENELSGQIQFEDGGRFNVALTYSKDNARDVTMDDLGMSGSDEATVDVEYHLWSNDNSGNYMTYSATSLANVDLTYLTVVENRNDMFACGGLVVVSKVTGQNLFTLRTPEGTNVSSECNVTPPGETLPDGSGVAFSVDLPYSGLGALYDLDNDGNLEFIHLMASKGSGAGATSQVLYNQFIVQ